MYGPDITSPTITGWCVKHTCEASLDFPCVECLIEMPHTKEREYWVQHRKLSKIRQDEQEKEDCQKMLLGV